MRGLFGRGGGGTITERKIILTCPFVKSNKMIRLAVILVRMIFFTHVVLFCASFLLLSDFRA